MKYCLNPSARYTVDKSDIKIILPQNGELVSIGYPEAAILDLIIKKYDSNEILFILQKIAHVTDTHALSIFNDTITEFINLNIVLQNTEGKSLHE
ncbi:MAG: hypothetical protein PHO32_03430 [Candidatus Cloacimonetes bacterium]|nr:hypothetical protein [Candidatus Cloacimonadota bacterium]